MRADVRGQIAEGNRFHLCNLTFHLCPFTLSEARALKLLPEVWPLHLHNAAHLVKAGTHTLADAVAQCFLPGGSSRWRKRSSYAGSRFVGKVCGDNRRPIVVIASVEDQAHCVPHPLATPPHRPSLR